MMRTSTALFRVALLAFPRPFRRRYGAELVEAFEASHRDAAGESLHVLGACADAVRTGLAERMAARGYREGTTRLRIPARGLSALARDFVHDLRYSVRDLRRSPGTVVVLTITLGLGLGANIAIFSAAWGVLGRPLPFDHAPDLVRLVQERPDFDGSAAGSRELTFSVAEIEDYAGSAPLEEVAEYHGMSFNMIGPHGATRVSAGVVSSNYFDFVGMKPLYGRLFTPGEDELGAAPVVVLSHDFWLDAFDGDPDAVGSWIEMNGARHQVVGVLPPIPQFPSSHDIYLPISVCPTRSSEAFIENRGRRMMTVYARLAPDWTVERARSEIADFAGDMRAAHPEAYDFDGGFAADLTPMGEDLVGDARPVVWALVGAAALLLLITCANASSVILSRASRRWEQSAIRGALGAGRGRMLRQHLTEGLLLATLGCGLGWAIALLGHDALVDFAARFTTRAQQIQMDGDVLGFAGAATALLAAVLGLAPLAASRGATPPSLGASTATQTRRARAWQRRLVTLQVAVAFVALSGAALLLRSLVAADTLDLGLPTEGVLTAEVSLDAARFQTLEEGNRFLEEVSMRLHRHPSVRAVARLPWPPLAEFHEHRNGFFLTPPGGATPVAAVGDLRVVSPSAFEVLDMGLVQGRLLAPEDGADAPRVAVVNQTFFDGYMGEGFPLGSVGQECLPDGRCDEPVTIVGVVEDIRSNGTESEVIPEVYVPAAQNDWLLDVFAVRVEGDPTPVADELRAIVAEMDPTVPVTHVGTLEDFRQDGLAPRRFLTALIGLAATVAVGLALAGIFGISHLTASARMQEMGLRRALGARSSDVVGLVLKEGAWVVGAGLLVGAVVSWNVDAALGTLLLGVPPHDLVTLVGVAVLFLATAAASVVLPARRVAQQDVMRTLSTPWTG